MSSTLKYIYGGAISSVGVSKDGSATKATRAFGPTTMYEIYDIVFYVNVENFACGIVSYELYFICKKS